MHISWIKYKDDEESFRIQEKLGFDVVRLIDLDNTDREIEKLINKNYKTIIVSNEVASFSEDIIKKYKYDTNVNIIISPSKKEE